MLRAMVKKAELEINGKMMETVKRLEDPVQRQRNLVEQERQKYLNEEERVVKKLWWVQKPLRIRCFCLAFTTASSETAPVCAVWAVLLCAPLGCKTVSVLYKSLVLTRRHRITDSQN